MNGSGLSGVTGSPTGVGVYGGNNSGGYAMQAYGNTTQPMTTNGWVKFMAYIDPYQSDPIRQCFNSQLPGTQATTGNCGFTADMGSDCEAGRTIDFGAKVDDRFVSVTPLANNKGDISAELFRNSFVTQNQWVVITSYTSVTATSDYRAQATRAPFFIIVY